ncbi:MAG: hypothetical protein R3264_00850, partial [Anaerolineae bacterium]|nr:hypothetical protein [Anaerolineae bacterium]
MQEHFRLRWLVIWPLLIGLGGGFLVALWMGAYIAQAPSNELVDLSLFLLTSSVPSLLFGYLAFIIGRRWLRSIRYKTLLAYSLGIIITVINIYVTAQLMFVSPHDFILLGILLLFAGIL